MENIRRVTEHLAVGRSRSRKIMRDWQTLELVPTLDGNTHVVDRRGQTWRMFNYVESSMTIQAQASSRQLFSGRQGVWALSAGSPGLTPPAAKRNNCRVPRYARTVCRTR